MQEALDTSVASAVFDNAFDNAMDRAETLLHRGELRCEVAIHDDHIRRYGPGEMGHERRVVRGEDVHTAIAQRGLAIFQPERLEGLHPPLCAAIRDYCVRVAA